MKRKEVKIENLFNKFNLGCIIGFFLSWVFHKSFIASLLSYILVLAIGTFIFGFYEHKKKYYNLMLLLFVSSVYGIIVSAYSDPVNTTLTEFGNFTRADNAMEVTAEVNTWTGGLFGIMILLMVTIILTLLGLQYTSDIIKAFTPAIFVSSVVSVLLRITNLLDESMIYICFTLLIISAGIGYATRK